MISMMRLRGQLEEVLGVAMREETWEFLVSRGYIAEVLEGKRSFGELAKEVQALQRAFGPAEHEQHGALLTTRGHRSVSRTGLSTERGEMISGMLAEEAHQDPHVQEIRHRLLGGKLLLPEKVAEWIQDVAEDDGLPSWWLTSLDVLIPQDDVTALLHQPPSETPPLQVSAEEVVSHIEFRLLRYRTTTPRGGIEERAIPIARSGKLEQLRDETRRLSGLYGWSESEATTFVLTGQVILIPALTVGVHIHQEIPALSRITLTVDPALTPREVAEQYATVRRQVVGARPRTLSSKHMNLALCAARRKPGEPWAQVMAQWNRDYPNDKYTQETNFARDCMQAQRRLLRPAYREI